MQIPFAINQLGQGEKDKVTLTHTVGFITEEFKAQGILMQLLLREKAFALLH